MQKRVLAICGAAAGLWAGCVHAQVAPQAGPEYSRAIPAAVPALQPTLLSATQPPAISDSGSFDGARGSFNALPAIAAPLPDVVPLSLVEVPQSIYPESPRTGEALNSGGVNFGLDVGYFSDYIYRGIDQRTQGVRSENALQFDVSAEFNLGKLPHPFIGLFVNVFNNDPVSRFEEVRPYFGLDWNLKPITVIAGFNSYIHPNRKNLDTQEVFAKLVLDDSLIFRTPHPIFSPYIYGAYDIDLYNGFYLEAGIKHDFVFEDIGLTLTPHGDVAYVTDNPLYIKTRGRDFGLQHYDVGLAAKISLSHAFNIDPRYGQWSIIGYMNYTAGIDKDLKADTLIWGGAGLEFRY